jgi:uncharacterized protein YcfJ
MAYRFTKLIIPALCLASAGAWAVEYADVLSSTPVQVSVPVVQRQCFDEPVFYQQPSSGAGALIGAIAGAALGNGFGSGAGRAAATGLGLVAGAAVGDRVEMNGAAPVASTVQRCRSVTAYQNRTIGYDVVYDFQGLRRSVRLARDPGAQIALEVTARPVDALAPGREGMPQGAPVYATPGDLVYLQPPPRVVVLPQPIYAYPAPILSIGGFYGGGRGGYGGGYGGGYVGGYGGGYGGHHH